MANNIPNAIKYISGEITRAVTMGSSDIKPPTTKPAIPSIIDIRMLPKNIPNIIPPMQSTIQACKIK